MKFKLFHPKDNERFLREARTAHDALCEGDISNLATAALFESFFHRMKFSDKVRVYFRLKTLHRLHKLCEKYNSDIKLMRIVRLVNAYDKRHP
jgi:hypothetical protein